MAKRTPWSILLAPAVLYLGIGLTFMTPHVTNADAISYISIAKKYARGEVHEAVSALWSPLLSRKVFSFLRNFHAITGGRIPGLRIFDLKSSGFY